MITPNHSRYLAAHEEKCAAIRSPEAGQMPADMGMCKTIRTEGFLCQNGMTPNSSTDYFSFSQNHLDEKGRRNCYDSANVNTVREALLLP